jgi:hypothetical protein
LRIARVLSAVAAPDSLERLLAAVIMNTIVGNADAHGKNFSLLHEASGALRMTPLYDVLSTLYYGDDHLSLYIDNVHRTNRVTGLRLPMKPSVGASHAIAPLTSSTISWQGLPAP